MTIVVVGMAMSCAPATDPDVLAHDLECRILAPCCWRETISDHDSEIAALLRAEVRSRIGAGEPAASIETDLVRRYGDEIRALPNGRDPRWLVGLAPGLALVAALFILRRRVRRPADVGPPTVLDLADEDRLDDELRDVD
ncbi:MAG TPA: cytochrome c-type biogenesis protein CcmH [Kofleriaceae bacterium]|jgi:cytochrome c-type biogenesis protein CcmH|nr:cytochrome c-type biogenesis protein CcmH [Kofleriaceae bacterium]